MPGLESVKTCHWCARLVRNKSAHSGGKKYAQVVRNHRAYFTQSAHFSRNSFTQSGCAKPPGDTVDEQPRRTSQTLPRLVSCQWTRRPATLTGWVPQPTLWCQDTIRDALQTSRPLCFWPL